MSESNRKDLIRAYRDADRPMGVFQVAHPDSGVNVVGASVDLDSMLNRQRAQLSMGSHPDKALQREWDTSGGAGFVFEVLDTLDPADDPAYDPSDDLEQLLVMWRERLGESS
jgi:hypothetical protein